MRLVTSSSDAKVIPKASREARAAHSVSRGTHTARHNMS